MKKLLMTASSWGHIRHFHLPYLHAFHEMGWTVHVGCADAPPTAPDIDECITLPFTKKMSAPQNFAVSRQLRATIKREQYDLIICHTSLAACFTRLALIGLPNHPHVINMVHGYLFDDSTPPLKKFIYHAAEKCTAPVTDLVLTMNHWDYTYAKQHELGREIQNIHGIGVDFTPFYADCSVQSADFDISEDAFVLIYPAEFSKRKNQQMLIHAMTALPKNVHLLLLGRGDLLEECQELAVTLGVDDRVRFPGFVQDIAKWYHIADVAVSASRSEGLPFNIMEAMACGLPVIVSDVKGHQDLVTSEEIGLRYPYNNKDAFINAVHTQMNTPQSPVHRARRQAAVVPYDISIVRDEVLAVYGAPQPEASIIKS